MVSTDKLLHLLVGALIVALLWPVSGTVSAVCCFVAAVGKEIYDDQYRDVHTPDMLDIFATLAGGGISALWLKSLDWWM